MERGISPKDFEAAGKEYCSEEWSFLVNGTLSRRYPNLKVRGSVEAPLGEELRGAR